MSISPEVADWMNQRTICGAPVEYKGHWIECELLPDHDTDIPDDPHRFVTSHFARHVDHCKGNCIPPWAHEQDRRCDCGRSPANECEPDVGLCWRQTQEARRSPENFTSSKRMSNTRSEYRKEAK